MLKPGLETSEGKKSLGIIAAGAFFIYYILSHRYNTPPVENILVNAESALDIAKAYATEAQLNTNNVSGDAFDISAVIGLLFGMYKTFFKYSDDRSGLKKEELKKEAAIALNSTQTETSLNDPAVNSQQDDLKKF